MPVQAEKPEPFAVQKKSVHVKTRLAQTNSCSIIVQRLVVEHQRDNDLVKLRRIHVPEFDVAQIGQGQRHFRLARFFQFKRPGNARNQAFAIQHVHPHLQCFARNHGRIHCASHFDPAARAQHVHRLGEHVADKDLRHGAQRRIIPPGSR